MSGFRRDLHHVLAHLEAAQRVAGLASWEFDVSEATVRWSTTAERFVGAAAVDESSLDRLVSTVVPGDREQLRAALDRVIGGGPAETLTVAMAAPDGATRHVRHHIDAIRDVAGAPKFALGTMMDCTDEVEDEAHLASVDARRRELLDAVLRGTDEHRTRIVHALHDGPIQQLTVAALRLEALVGRDGHEATGRAVDALRDAVAELRDVLVALDPRTLRPADVTGSFEALAASVAVDVEVRCEVGAEPDPDQVSGLLQLASDVLRSLDPAEIERVLLHYAVQPAEQVLELHLVPNDHEAGSALDPVVEAAVQARAAVLDGEAAVLAEATSIVHVRVPNGVDRG